MNDVTEPKRPERSLALMSFALNNVHEAAYLIDESGRFLYANEEASRMLGYSRGQLLALSVPEIDPDSSAERWPSQWAKVRDERSMRFDGHHRSLDGRIIPVEINATYLQYEDQAFVLALVRDIADRQKAEEALRRLNRELRAVSNCNEALIRASDEKTLLADVCRIVCEEAGYQMAWVGYAEHDAARTLRPMAWGGIESGYLTEMKISWGEGANGADRPAAQAIRTGATIRLTNIGESPRPSEWHSQPAARGYRSSLALPLKDDRERTFGVLVVYSPERDAFGPDEARLLEGLAGDLAFGITVLRARHDLHGANEERLDHVQFLESLDQVNRAIQGTTDLDEMMAGVLDVVLSIFGCDRAALLYPCDPTATTFSAPMERTKPEFPGIRALNLQVPVDPDAAQMMRIQLATDGPVTMGPRSAYPVPPGLEAAFHVKSVMGMTLRPKFGKPWQFAIHQCGHEREWTVEEVRLFAEVAHRLEDGLTALQTRRELERQIEAHRMLLDQASDAIFVCDANFRYIDVNQAACQLLGYTREELLALSIPDVVPPIENPGQDARLNLMQAGEANLTERVLRRKDGTLVTAELSARRLSDARYQAIVRDITERKRLEKEQARLATAVDQADEAMIITDPSGTILYVNPAFEHITGYTRAEVLGCNPRILQSGKHDATFYESMWSTLLAGQTWRGTLTNRHKDGSLFQEEATITPIRDDDGRVVSYVGVKRDVTRELALEAQLRQSQKMEAVGQLAGGIAHDFNNLITAIRGYSELVRESLPLEAPTRGDLDQIVFAADRAAELTRQLLAFSRRQVLIPEVIAPTEVVEGIVPMLRRLLGEHIELVTIAAPDVGRIRVDPSQLEQIIVNLAVNARDAMSEGGRLVIETMNVQVNEPESQGGAERAPGQYVVLRVTDTGCGMDETTMARAFEPFFTTKEPGQGSGMGLATVYGILRQSGGDIELLSEVGRGTTFTIWLQRAHEERTAAVAASAEATVAHGSGTILLVEDDPSVRAIARRTLEDLGYAVVEAEDGAAAIAWASENPAHIDLLVTDVVMPRVGGSQLAQGLRASMPDLPVLFMSGFSEEATRLADLSVPGAMLISKPFTREALGRAVQEALEGR